MRNHFAERLVAAALTRAGCTFPDGTAALANELDSFRLAGARTVLVPALACDRLLAAILLSGISFALVDCAPGSLQPSLSQYVSAAGGRLGADIVLIVAGHWGHWPDDCEEIAAAGAAAGASILWDAANSWGLCTSPEAEKPWSVISFGATKPVELGLGGASKAKATPGQMLGCSRGCYDEAMRAFRERAETDNQPLLSQFSAFVGRHSSARLELEGRQLLETARSRGAPLDLQVRRQRRATEYLLESAHRGGWLDLRHVPGLEFHTRLIALTPDRDLVRTKLRGLGVWVGSETAAPLGLLLRFERCPNAQATARSACSFLTAQPAAQLFALGEALRAGL